MDFKKWGAQAWEPYISLRLCLPHNEGGKLLLYEHYADLCAPVRALGFEVVITLQSPAINPFTADTVQALHFAILV